MRRRKVWLESGGRHRTYPCLGRDHRLLRLRLMTLIRIFTDPSAVQTIFIMLVLYCLGRREMSVIALDSGALCGLLKKARSVRRLRETMM
jgi:hypothetical protein